MLVISPSPGSRQEQPDGIGGQQTPGRRCSPAWRPVADPRGDAFPGLLMKLNV